MAGYLAHRMSRGRLPVPDDAREFAGASLLDMGRVLAGAHGHRGFIPQGQVLDLMTRMGGLHSTSDFALLMNSGSERALLDTFARLPPALIPVARRVTTSDFRPIQKIRMGTGSDLRPIGEHGEYTRGTVGTKGETYAVETRGIIFGFTRQLIVNDDLAALTDFIEGLGRKASVTLGDLLFNTLNANPVMADGTALFHANHQNQSASAAAPSVATLSAARLAMRGAKDVDGATAQVSPRYLIVGPTHETDAEKLLADLSAGTVADQNPFSGGKLALVVEPRLAGTTWYLASDPAVARALEYAELDGSRPMGGTGPQIDSRVGFDVDGIEIRCRYDVGAGVVDWVGLYRNS